VSYKIAAAYERASLPRGEASRERADRDRTLERVRRAVRVRDKAREVASVVDKLVAEDPWQCRTRLLAQAMFDGALASWDLEALIVSEFLASPGKLNWQGAENWTFASRRQKEHRFQYIDNLVCFFAHMRNCRPDSLAVSAGRFRKGDRLMDFILAAASRPLEESGEMLGDDQLMNLVNQVKANWVGRFWGDPELAEICGEEEAEQMHLGGISAVVIPADETSPRHSSDDEEDVYFANGECPF